MIRIGIDVGGTNTDAVYLKGDRILAATKCGTTADVISGIRTALGTVLSQAPAADVQAVMIGTTHFTNAVIERQGLSRVGILRIGLPSAASIPPMCGWPQDLRDAVEGPVFMVEGGHEFDGRPIVRLDEAQLGRIARQLADQGITSVAITSVFSPLTDSCETRAAEILRSINPGLAVTCSAELGRIGLVERENATILNAALHDLAGHTIRAFQGAVAEMGLNAPLYITQNDGTVVPADQARAFPVLCFASGPTNSMRGARVLSGVENAIVLDVGGTTTDAGVLIDGFPRLANGSVDVGGVRTVFQMPDVLAVALGGGTVVEPSADGHLPLRLGPESVGYRIGSQARVNGGPVLTLTDIAVASGAVSFGDPTNVANLSESLCKATQSEIAARLAQLVDRMRTSAVELPVIAVGGGAFLVPDRLDGVSEVLRVENAGVANAVGAAMVQVSGVDDRVHYGVTRAEAIVLGRQAAEARAVEAGADPASLELQFVEDTPMAYIPGAPLRVQVRVTGRLLGAG